jgi:hypothetical protein
MSKSTSLDAVSACFTTEHYPAQFIEHRSGSIGLKVFLVPLFRRYHEPGTSEAPQLPLHGTGPRLCDLNDFPCEESTVRLAKK